jgi:hypothetical protein
MEGGDRAGRGLEVPLRVLGVDPELDGVPTEDHRLLREGEGLAGGDEDLLLHEVEAGGDLGDRVLHLDPGVHLDEVEGAVLVEEELHRAGAHVVDGLGGLHRGVAHGLPELGREGRGGRLLHELLVAPLDRAVPLPQVDHPAVGIAEDLDLHVPRPEDALLQVDRRVAEGASGLGARRLEELREGLGVVGDPHPLPAPARRRLDHDRIPDPIGELPGLGHILHEPGGAGNGGDPGLDHRGAGCRLVPHGPDLDAVGPMKVRFDLAQISEKSAFSARKPYPGWIASAPVISAAAMIRGMFR